MAEEAADSKEEKEMNEGVSRLPEYLDHSNAETFKHEFRRIMPLEPPAIGIHRLVECVEHGHDCDPSFRLTGRGSISHIKIMACCRCGLMFFEDATKKGNAIDVKSDDVK